VDELVAPNTGVSPNTAVCNDTGGGGCSAYCGTFCAQQVKTCDINCFINIILL